MVMDLLRDCFSSDSSWLDKFMGLLLLVTVVMVIWLVLILFDSVGIKSNRSTTTSVDAKMVVAPYTTFLLVGKVTVPQHHPESYMLKFKIDGTEVSSPVDKDFFANVNAGDHIEIHYGLGRLSKSYQPKEIRLVGK